MTFVSQDFGIRILSLSSQVSTLCFAPRLSGILLVQCHRLACRDGSTQRGRLFCLFHMSTLRTSNTPWFCGYRRHTPFTGHEPKYQFDDSKKFTNEKRSIHADSSGRESLRKNNEQFTSSTSCSTFRSVF